MSLAQKRQMCAVTAAQVSAMAWAIALMDNVSAGQVLKERTVLN
jgi:hypothetical protein